ncbi:MAG: PD-(D/E)XK nuclease family protein [Defluviitaleaceae bacterium]|nr:PD-(D/E)XK nuclease family protein [Defluviitaleaceae bacterium]MCL2240760.1 PD-(D/E)XK nuclease family protein [Defluviitaleaceae bacterium]
MALQFILGAPGTGKTTLCLKEIEASLPGDAPLYYLVPEQFSLQSERLLLARREATMRVQVLSFNRLAYRLFAALGGPPGRMADELAKAMLLRKVLFENAEALQYYGRAHDKHGFVDALAHTLTELNHYRITADDLYARAETAPEGEGNILAAKLSDLALLVEKYREAVSGRYLLTDDMLDLLVERLRAHSGALPLLDGARIWVDGFSGFTPQERMVLLWVMKRAAYLGITLTTRDEPGFSDPLCHPPRFTQEKITYIAEQAGIGILPPVYMKENFRHAHNPGLAFFVGAFSLAPLPGAGEGIELISARDPYEAVLAAASQIHEWVQNRGYRFRDIAILCGDRNRYEKILCSAFDRLNIPLFVDTETDILSHPLTELIRAAFDMVNRNFNYESVFRFLKTGLVHLPQDDVDVLENYALAQGIAGYRWRYPMDNPVAEKARVYLMDVLKNFAQAGRKDSVTGFSQKVFHLLYALDVPGTLSRWFDAYINAGDPETARMHKQIWPKLCEIFDKLVEILGDTPITVQEFSSLLDAGFARAGLGRIPPTLNQVVLGDMGRSRYPAIKAMLVLGANEGTLPPPPASPGLFTDDERVLLRNAALELAPEITDRVNEQYYALYCALSQPADMLAFIYAENESSGAVFRPSPVIRIVKALFPTLSAKAATPILEYRPLEGNPDGISIHETAPTSSPVSPNPLFGPIIHTAASRLEAYARCPFAYYLTYLLKAKPRKQYEVLPADLGILFHGVVALFAQRMGWQPRTKAEIGEIVATLVAELAPENTATTAYHGSARNRHILEKARRVCTASIWALTEQIRQTDYTPAFAEIDLPPAPPISLDNGQKLALSGRIDRVDLHPAPDGRTYVQIIDYKSGHARFSPNDIRNGTQLQLMLYMNAMLKSPGIKNPHPGGIYYFPISDPLLKTNILLEDSVREAALLKQFKLSGIAPDEKNNALFTHLRETADAKIKELATQLASGNIAPAPCPQNGRKPCEYCSYGAICGSGVV